MVIDVDDRRSVEPRRVKKPRSQKVRSILNASDSSGGDESVAVRDNEDDGISQLSQSPNLLE